MSIDLSQDEIDALDSDTQRIGILFRLDVDPIARWWLGVGDFMAGINAFDALQAKYAGMGQLLDLPPLQQLINGVADRVSFRVSGVSRDTQVLASQSTDDIKGAALVIGIVLFGADWRQLGIPKWLWAGSADFVTLSQQNDNGQIVRTIDLSVGSLFTGRRRRAFSYFTDQDQQGRRPGDTFCERTVLYSSDTDKVWPVFS